jgi:hypothetical protein
MAFGCVFRCDLSESVTTLLWLETENTNVALAAAVFTWVNSMEFQFFVAYQITPQTVLFRTI